VIPEYPEPPKHVEVWWVLPDLPVAQIATSDGEELACVWGVLYGMRADHSASKHQVGDLTVTVLRTPQEALVVQEPSMRTFMRVMRANGIHGAYRKAGGDRTYRF
jgi:hypothetical protein